jgi:DNA-binding MarR family transcriptional regulator
MQPSSPDAAQCAHRLRGAVTLLSRRLRPALQDAGLSVAKLSVIGRLYRTGPMTPTELAQREGVMPQSLTRLLAELEADGWLARKADAADGRRSLLRLTRSGARRLVTAVQAGEASLAEIIDARLNPQQRALLLEACALLDDIAGVLDPAAAAARRE